MFSLFSLFIHCFSSFSSLFSLFCHGFSSCSHCFHCFFIVFHCFHCFHCFFIVFHHVLIVFLHSVSSFSPCFHCFSIVFHHVLIVFIVFYIVFHHVRGYISHGRCSLIWAAVGTQRRSPSLNKVQNKGVDARCSRLHYPVDAKKVGNSGKPGKTYTGWWF